MEKFPKDVYCTSIDTIKEFDRDGYHCIRIANANNFYLFRLNRGDCKIYTYEVWRGKKHKQPDGTIVYVKPSTEQFGHYGWFIVERGIDRTFNNLKEKFPEFPIDQFKEAVNNHKK